MSTPHQPKAAQAVRVLTLLALVLGVTFVALFGFTSLTRSRSFSPDSMNYIDVARNLAEGRGLTQSTLGFHDIRFLGRQDWPVPFTAQPPLYPVLIAGLSKLGMDASDGALALPAAAFAGTLALAWLLLRRVWGASAAWLGVALLAVHFPLNFTARIAWSEAPGLLLVLLALLPSRGVSLPARAAFAGLACGLAFANRYAAAPLAIAAGVGIVLSARAEPTSRKLLCLSAFGLPLAACVLPILFRNATLYGHFFPQHFGSQMALDVALYQTFASLFGTWLGRFNSDLEGIALLAILLVCFALARRGGAKIREAALPVGAAPLVIWIVLYLGFIVYQCLTIHLDELGPRLLLPASAPLLLWIAGVAARTLRIPVIASLGICCGALGLRAWEEVNLAGNLNPAPSVEARVLASPRVAWIKANVGPDDLVVGDDAIDLPFLLGPRRVASFSPYPATDYPDYAKLIAWADARGENAKRIFVVLRRFSGSETELKRRYGEMIADLLAGRVASYPRIQPRASLSNAAVFEILQK